MKASQLGLLLVDVQRAFWQPLASLPHAASFPANMRTLLETARANRLPVIHMQSVFRPDGSDWMLFYGSHGRGPIPCIAGTGDVRIEDFVAPLEGEMVLHKQTFDGFVNTGLEETLRSRDIRALLIAGLVTSVCVLFTATSAYLRRIVPLVVNDACADAADQHEATLRTYGGLCFQTVTTAQARDDLPSVLRLAERWLP
jgi:nicotinamidase-related amidase